MLSILIKELRVIWELIESRKKVKNRILGNIKILKIGQVVINNYIHNVNIKNTRYLKANQDFKTLGNIEKHIITNIYDRHRAWKEINQNVT